MGKRTIVLLVAFALIAAGVIAYILVRRGSPPSVVKLLPAADDYLYFNVAMVRRSNFFHGLPPVQFDPDYAEFVRQTGFDFEKDLDEAAFALQRPAATATTAPAVPPSEWKNTGIFTASFDQPRLEAYLKGVAQGVETYRNTIIYSVPLPGRTVRIAILNARTVAISNTDGPYVLRGIIDRAAEFGGGAPALVHDYYGKVPWGSVAWAIARPAPVAGGNERLQLPGGFALFLPADTVLVASVRYLGSIDLRAQAFAPTPEGAAHVAEQLSAFLSVFHVLENNQANGRDKDVKAFFDSIQVTHQDGRAELRANIPADFLKKLAASASASDTTPVPAAPRQR
jgi:hypothetical protein